MVRRFTPGKDLEMMHPQAITRDELPGLRRFLEILLGAYMLSGLYGTFWIDDEFSGRRAAAVAFVGIPMLTFKYLLDAQQPQWKQLWPHWHRICHSILLATFLWGNVLILNAIGETQQPVVVTQNLHTATMTLHQTRGSLGILYTRRW